MTRRAMLMLLVFPAGAVAAPGGEVQQLELINMESLGELILSTAGQIFLATLPLFIIAAVIWGIVNFGYMLISGQGVNPNLGEDGPVLDEGVGLDDDQLAIVEEAIKSDRAEKAKADADARRRKRIGDYLDSI